MERRQQMERLTTPYNPNTPGVDRYFGQDGIDPSTTGSTTQGPRPEVDMSSADPASQRAGAIGSDIGNALAVTARPMVDTAARKRPPSLPNQLKATLARVGGAVQQATSSVTRQMNRNFADHGAAQ